MKREPKEPQATTTIQNCTFNGVQWDAKALESVQTVARALLNLTELFKSQNLTIDTMVKIQGTTDPVSINDSRFTR